VRTHLNENLGVESVHERERQVEVENAGNDLEGRVGGVLRVADVRRDDATTAGHEVMPADDWHNPQRRH